MMLFLAVFCGFLAENFREHQVEHKMEHQYMVTMLEDLKADTVLLREALDYWNDRNKSVDTVAEAIRMPVSKQIFTGFTGILTGRWTIIALSIMTEPSLNLRTREDSG